VGAGRIVLVIVTPNYTLAAWRGFFFALNFMLHDATFALKRWILLMLHCVNSHNPAAPDTGLAFCCEKATTERKPE
jgi:hypothetical protein